MGVLIGIGLGIALCAVAFVGLRLLAKWRRDAEFRRHVEWATSVATDKELEKALLIRFMLIKQGVADPLHASLTALHVAYDAACRDGPEQLAALMGISGAENQMLMYPELEAEFAVERRAVASFRKLATRIAAMQIE